MVVVVGLRSVVDWGPVGVHGIALGRHGRAGRVEASGRVVAAMETVGPMSDHTTTDQPAHYTAGAVEVIDTIREALGKDGFRAFCRGNVIKYSMRAGRKGDEAEDMRKAANYARWASGEEWRPGGGPDTPYTDALARWHAEHPEGDTCDDEAPEACPQCVAREPVAVKCRECVNTDCTDRADGLCCTCYAYEYGGHGLCAGCRE